MSLRFILGGALALPLLFAGGALASSPGPSVSHASPGMEARQRIDFGTGDQPDSRPVLVAQADPRINGLEEQLRDLNGKIEELNFQVLQMQDQMRKMQEDNEFRFQQLEGGGGSSGGQPPQQQKSAPADKRSSLEPPRSEATAAANPPPPSQEAVPAAQAAASGGGPQLGAPPQTFGTITFDANGNVVDSSANRGSISRVPPLSPSSGGQEQGATVAALPPAGNADELYRNSYQFILSGEYKTAEAGFRKHIQEFPGDPRASDANFWLGEALLGQHRYRDAAEVFLKANRKYPDAKKAPDMLLKLGISLSAMNQRDVACATYGEIGQRYPDITSALKQRVKQEESLAGC